MEKLLIYRERFLKFLTARGRYIQSGMRFLGGTVLFYVLGKLFGYTETFSQPFFIFMMGVNMQAVENKRRLAPSSDKSLSLEKLSDIQENIIQLPVQKIMSLLTIHEVTLRI